MTIQQLMDRKDATDCQDFFCKMLDLDHLRDRPIKKLSGGELQRMAIALVCVGKAWVGFFFLKILEQRRSRKGMPISWSKILEIFAKWYAYKVQSVSENQETKGYVYKVQWPLNACTL